MSEINERYERVRQAIKVRLHVDIEEDWPVLRALLKTELERADSLERDCNHWRREVTRLTQKVNAHAVERNDKVARQREVIKYQTEHIAHLMQIIESKNKTIGEAQKRENERNQSALDRAEKAEMTVRLLQDEIQRLNKRGK